MSETRSSRDEGIFITVPILGGCVEAGVFFAMMIGAIPAVVLMFYMLDPFEGLFNEQSTFFAFIIGMVVGVVVGVIHVGVDPWALQTYATSLLIFVLGFAIFDTFLRVVLFNSAKFSMKMETTFYSTAFSLGYGAMLAALWFYRSFTHPTVETNAWVIAAYIAAAFAFAVVYGSTGMLLGFGAYEGEMWRLAALSVILHTVLNLLWWMALASSIYTQPGVYPVWELGVLLMGIAALYGIFLFRWTMNKVVPDLLPKDTMKHRRRLLRKRQRLESK
jgi:hypothetical protein